MAKTGIMDGAVDSILFEGAGATSPTSRTGSEAGGAADASVQQGTGEADDYFDNFDTRDAQASGDATLAGATTVSTGTSIAGAIDDAPERSAATSAVAADAAASQLGASADAGQSQVADASGPNIFDWVVASGDFGAASSWGVGLLGGGSGPPTAADYAEIEMNANVFGGGVAYNLDFDAAVAISSPLTTTVAGIRTVIGAKATGSVTVSSTWNAVGQLQIGGFSNNGAEAPAGTLTVDAGGVVDNTGAALGADIGVDSGGAGTLTVEGGGQFSVTQGFGTQGNNLTLGVNPGSVGIMTISGAGSTVTIAGQIVVCSQGVGEVTVENGGSLFTNGVNGYFDLVGNQAGSTGTMTVTGANSVWKSANSINVGEEKAFGGSGIGTMSATLGGYIQSAQRLSVWTGSTIYVDSSSVIESGPTGGAKPGYLTLDADNGSLYGDGTVDGNVIDDSSIDAIVGGPLTINGAITGDGGMAIGLDGDLVLNSSVALTGAGSIVNFYSWYGTLSLFDPAQFSVPIYNFMPGDTIDLTNTPYDASDSSISYTAGANQLVVTEGSATYDFNVTSYAPLSGTLKMKPDASGAGTDIVFTSSPASPFNLWSSLPDFYSTLSGPVNGEDWGISDATNGGNPLWVETETPASSYAPGAAGDYTIVMTTQDWLGDEQPLVTVATDNDIVDPFGKRASAIGDLAAAVTFGASSTTGEGAVLYWQASATPGDYALVLQPTTTTYPTAPSAGPSTVLTGSPVTLAPAVGDPTSWTENTGTPTSLVVAYATAVMPTTENLWFQAFTNTGQATTQAVEVLANVPDSTQYRISYSIFTGAYGYEYTEVDGGESGLYAGTFDPATGALGAADELISTPSFTTISGLAVHDNLSSDSSLTFLEGVDNGQAVIEAFFKSPRFSTSPDPTATFDLGGAADHFEIADVFDPNDDQLDYTALAYTDNNQVHLELLDADGLQIGSDFVVPGLTSFDAIHTLTVAGDFLDADTRVEIDYTVADPGGGKEIKGLIYDTAGAPDYYPLNDANYPFFYTPSASGDNEYDGTPFDDTVLYAPGVYTIDGGGGTDTFFATNFTASQLNITVNAQGDVVLSDGQGDVDTLVRFSTINLSRASIGIYGDVLVRTSSDDGSKIVSTFNIGGNPAATSVLNYSASLTLTSATLNGGAQAVTGSGAPIYLNSAQAAVTGGGDTIYFSSGSGNAAGLYATGSNWDAVDGSGGVIALTDAYANVTGSGDAVYLEGSGNAVAFSGAGADWNSVNGSGGLVELTDAPAIVSGGGDAVDFEGASGNVAALYSTAGVWDGVTGSNGEVVLTSAYAELFGGGDAVYLEGGPGNALAIYNSGGQFDNVNGSGALVVLTNADAEITGGGNSIYLEGASPNVAALYNTGDVYDGVNGSNGEVVLTSAQAEITGGGNTVYIEGSGNTAALYNTGASADTVSGSNDTVVLTNANATVTGSGDSIYFSGTNSVTANGASDAFVFQPTIGEDTINSFAATDTMQFSAADFANFAALQSHATQSGANTVITLDASDMVTLTGVAASSLVASQFHFV